MLTPLSISESDFNCVAQNSTLEGELRFSDSTKIFGKLKGLIYGKPGSCLILAESGTIEGQIECETIFINGFIEGNITAAKKIVLSPTAKVRGNLSAPSIIVEVGAYIEGNLRMEKAVTAPH